MAQTLGDFFSRLEKELPKIFEESVFEGLVDLQADMNRRIFRNQGGTDIEGNDFGEYKEYADKEGGVIKKRGKRKGQFRGWKGVRQSRGKFIGKRDFVFDSNLKESIRVGKDGNDYVLRFKNEKLAVIGRGLEGLLESEGRSGDVFEASVKESSDLFLNIEDNIIDKIEERVNR